jgi:hypothetical protein
VDGGGDALSGVDLAMGERLEGRAPRLEEALRAFNEHGEPPSG